MLQIFLLSLLLLDLTQIGQLQTDPGKPHYLINPNPDRAQPHKTSTETHGILTL
jgi:hypothetical protein